MIWLRKSFVHLLAILLFVVLLGTAVTTSLNVNFAKPDKVKSWLADSKLYDHALAGVLDNSQDKADKSGGDGSVSLSNPEVKKAAEAAFSPQLIQKSANTIIDGNYAWLQGKTATPTFTIDLTSAKQDFAKRVGQYVTTRLSGLPVCTPAQLAQIQIPVDVTTINCRPSVLSPQTEGNRVTQELNANGNFLDQPIVTASTLSQDQADAASKPYYQSASDAPKVYKKIKRAPFILTTAAIVLSIGIYYIAPTRRRGQRRLAWIFLISGVILVADKFISDIAINKVSRRLLNGVRDGDLRQSGTSLLHSVQSHVVQINLYFGIVFLVIAGALYVRLFKTREKSDEPKSGATESASDAPEEIEQPTPARPVSMDVTSTQSAPELPKAPPIKTSSQAPKLKKPRRPGGRLIQ